MKTHITSGDDVVTTTFVQRARATALSLLATGLLVVPATAFSAIVEIDFEGAGGQTVGDFYDGNPIDSHVVFTGENFAVEDSGSPGLFELAPSGSTAMLLIEFDPQSVQDGQAITRLEYAPGFTSVSFFYAALVAGGYQIFDDVGGTGTELLSGNLDLTPQSGCSVDIQVCDWVDVSVSGFGIARSIVFSGASGFVIFDDISLTPAPVPLPAAAWLLLSGLAGLGFFGRRRATAN